MEGSVDQFHTNQTKITQQTREKFLKQPAWEVIMNRETDRLPQLPKRRKRARLAQFLTTESQSKTSTQQSILFAILLCSLSVIN